MGSGKKGKKIAFELIPAIDNGHVPEPCKLLDEVRRKWHSDTSKARVALAWRIGFKPDVDGRLILGKCCKASGLQRELVDWDFVILLNREVWMEKEFTRERKIALLDHELCHASPALDRKSGQQRYDERIRPVWRTRGHDIEEFRAVVERHGCYKRDLERFAQALLSRKDQLFSAADPPPSAPPPVQIAFAGISSDGSVASVISIDAKPAPAKKAAKPRKRDPG